MTRTAPTLNPVDRISSWLRDKPIVADSALASILLLVTAVVADNAKTAPTYLAVSALIWIPVALRRTYPRAAALAALVLAFAASLVGLAADSDEDLLLLPQCIMLYTLVAYVGRRAGWWYLLGLLGPSAAMTALVDLGAQHIVFLAVCYVLCWTRAEFVGARHAYHAEVAARLAVAESDRERRAHDAVSAERTRIAREMHDVVAHAVSVIIVHADGAKYVLRRDQDAAEQALATIARTGREALRELRRTVSLLRTEHAPEQLPQHGVAGLAATTEMMRRAGLAVELESVGALDDITPEVSLGVQRIVQESLTNTLRHAGPVPRAWVRVRRTDSRVLIDITDSGIPEGAAAPLVEGAGLGLVGMRERIAVLGGTLSAGREADGAWRVCASIPLDPDFPE
ncbi:histidine kinase [Nocardia sp. CNY236]|uniref:sensor histidine kinase n=1 Tax=Nocardia sp. CNY236 TaxID=1169152 RepID=UPI0012DD1BBE